jgi:hypothetical protein
MMLPLQGHRVDVVDSRQGARDLQLRIGCHFRRNGILGYRVLPGSCRCQRADDLLHDDLIVQAFCKSLMSTSTTKAKHTYLYLMEDKLVNLIANCQKHGYCPQTLLQPEPYTAQS